MPGSPPEPAEGLQNAAYVARRPPLSVAVGPWTPAMNLRAYNASRKEKETAKGLAIQFMILIDKSIALTD
jgi:hypothetical protein